LRPTNKEVGEYTIVRGPGNVNYEMIWLDLNTGKDNCIDGDLLYEGAYIDYDNFQLDLKY